MRDLAINSRSHIFAATTVGNFRSEDNGVSWKKINKGLRNFGGLSLAVNANDEVFIGTWDGIYKSTNNGDNWSLSGASGRSILDLALNSQNQIFAAGVSPPILLRSTNDGESWESIHNGIPRNDIRTLAINLNDHIFAGSFGGGLFISKDNGNTWSASSVGLPNTLAEKVAIRPNGDIFLSIFDGLYLSNDNGESWMLTGFAKQGSIPQIAGFAFDKSGNIYVGTNDSGVFRSSDNGANWVKLATDVTGRFITALESTSSEVLLAGTSTGVFFSNDQGDSWVTHGNKGLSNVRIASLAINPEGHIFAGTLGIGFVRSTDSGRSWIRKNNGLSASQIISLAINSKGHIFAGTFIGGIYRSVDNGESWKRIHPSISNQDVKSISIDYNDHIFISTSTGPFRSLDNGESWMNLSSVLPSSNNLKFASSSAGYNFALVSGQGLFRSSDIGETWNPVNDGLTNQYVVTFAESSDGSIYVTASGGIYRSFDHGDNWSQAGFLNFNISLLTINSQDHIYTGSQFNDLFLSRDHGQNWEKIADKILTSRINTIAIDPAGFLYAGTEGSGVYKSIIPTTTSLPQINNNPTKFLLLQNYPNPFNPNTTIKFEIPSAGPVTLTVYDISGKLVTVLVTKNMARGIHETEFSGKGLSSGIYLCKLTFDHRTYFRKMLLAK